MQKLKVLSTRLAILDRRIINFVSPGHGKQDLILSRICTMLGNKYLSLANTDQEIPLCAYQTISISRRAYYT